MDSRIQLIGSIVGIIEQDDACFLALFITWSKAYLSSPLKALRYVESSSTIPSKRFLKLGIVLPMPRPHLSVSNLICPCGKCTCS